MSESRLLALPARAARRDDRHPARRDASSRASRPRGSRPRASSSRSAARSGRSSASTRSTSPRTPCAPPTRLIAAGRARPRPRGRGSRQATSRRATAPRRPAEHDDDAHRQRRRRADRPLLDRLHGRRPRGTPLFRVHRVLRLLDAHARRGREPADASRRLGARRPLVVPADRLLARAAERGAGGEEGVRDERVRRRDDGARALHPHRALSLALVRRARRLRTLVEHRQPRRARPARRRRGEVGADPAPDVAARRDGRPDAGQRPHPRGHDGHRGRLPHRAHAPHLRAGTDDRADRGRHRRAHASRRRADRARPDGHQARDRVLDDVADRLHVPRRRASGRTRAGCSIS